MIKNGTLAAGVVTELLPNLHSVGGFVLNFQDTDVWINFGTNDAAPNVGKYVQAGVDQPFSARLFPEMNARVTVYPIGAGNYSMTPNY